MALSQHFHTPKPIPLFMTLGAVALLLGLGIWQVNRLFWKEALIASIARANEAAPLQTLPDDLKAHEFYRVQLKGHFLPDVEFHLAARYFRSKLGYSIFTPFQLSDGRIVLVSRGWVPADAKEIGKHPAPPEGEITLLAQIRTTDERNPFTPINQPDKNIWFGRDVAAMGAHAGLTFLPLTLDMIGTQDPAILPVPYTGEIKLRNDHLSYAITWFALAACALTISLLYHRKKPAAS